MIPAVLCDRLAVHALGRGARPPVEPEQVRDACDREDAAAVEELRELKHAADDRYPPAFHRPAGEPVPWRHRGPQSDRHDQEAVAA